MTILDTVESKLSIAEVDVVTFFAKSFAAVKQEEAVVVADLGKVLQWVEAHGAEVSGLILGIITTVASAGIGVPAPVILAATLLNSGAQAVNQAIAAAQAHQAAGGGESQASILAEAVAAGSTAYGAFNHAKSVLASAAPSASVAK